MVSKSGNRSLFPLILSLLSIMALAFLACSNSGTQSIPEPTVSPKTTLTITGAGGTTRVLRFLAQAYMEQNNDLAFQFLSGSGSSGGVKGVLAGQLDLGAMSRPPKDSELSEGILHVGFAEDKVVVVTSPDVTISSLTSKQIQGIFAGEITKWSTIGGPNTEINVLIRAEKDSNTKLLRKGLLGDSDFGPSAAIIDSEGDMKNALSNTSGAIGYLAYSGVRLESLPLTVLAIDGNDPAILGGSYPIDTRMLGVAYLPGNADKVLPFLDFVTGPEAQELLSKEGIASVD